MKKYYGPIFLGIIALTLAAPVAQTTTVLATDSGTETGTTTDPDNEMVEYSGNVYYNSPYASGEVLTKMVTEEFPANLEKGTIISFPAPFIQGYYGEVTAKVGDDHTLITDKSAPVTYKDTNSGVADVHTNLTGNNSVIKINVNDLKIGVSTPVEIPTIDGYYTNDKKINITADEYGNFNCENSINYIQKDDNTVTAKATINTNINEKDGKDGQIVSTDKEFTGQIGSDILVDVPNVKGYYTNQKQVMAHINEDKTITATNKVTYMPRDSNTVDGSLTLNLRVSGKTFESRTINLTGAKNTTIKDLDAPVLTGYPYVSPQKFSVTISKDGKFTPSTTDFVYYQHTDTLSVDVPKTKEYPDGKYTFKYEYNNVEGAQVLPSIPGYYATNENGEKQDLVIIKVKDGKAIVGKIVWHKINNNNNSSSTTKPTTKPETKPEHTKTINAHHATFYALPNTITNLYDEDGQILKNRALGGNSSWIADKLMTLDGVNYLRVATDEWVKQNDGLEVTPLSHNVYTKNEARLYTASGSLVQDRALAKNTAWVTDKSAKINGQTMYRVATNEWVRAADLK